MPTTQAAQAPACVLNSDPGSEDHRCRTLQAILMLRPCSANTARNDTLTTASVRERVCPFCASNTSWARLIIGILPSPIHLRVTVRESCLKTPGLADHPARCRRRSERWRLTPCLFLTAWDSKPATYSDSPLAAWWRSKWRSIDRRSSAG